MGDYGIKVSQRNYDVRDAKDYKLEYSSSFPLLPIFMSGAFTGNTTITHNLGFVPAFFIVDDHNAGVDPYGAAGEAHCGNGLVNDTTLAYAGGTNGRYYIFGLDIEQNFLAPTVESGTVTDVQSGANFYGIKVAKEGKDVSSTDLRDFSIHSGTRSPLVHSITYGTKSASPFTVEVAHTLGYVPFFIAYIKNAFTSLKYRILTGASDAAIAADTDSVTMTFPYETTYSIVIFKDPMLVS